VLGARYRGERAQSIGFPRKQGYPACSDPLHSVIPHCHHVHALPPPPPLCPLPLQVLKKYIYGGHVAEYMEEMEEEDPEKYNRWGCV